MTFSLVARDATGALGAAICSSSPAVAARCVHLADGIGAVNSQNVTDPRLGPAVLDQLRGGRSATEALGTVTGGTPFIDHRQLLVVDDRGRAAVHSGQRALGVFGHAVGDGVAAGGNMLASAEIPQLMVDAFSAATGDLELRLMAAVRAAIDAGGEAGPVHSAGLSVVRDAGWRVTDLRVDWTDGAPIEELGRLLEVWLPQRDDYVTRGLDPTTAPSYGVPGDE
ncbi:DUF1028 domain-containing protein [Modestobacter sp. VKM Ac-2978]|uniref:DUF1028 domain-containing protein n=1 Tax=Modestobacter sp. VKM Ac-2978 TaxID=3004132 RepID=UPI0022AA4868|nr:DUF1028 domain-containing protein [Modestobacter sp. VKM Ac-2978]MCZ2849828.1 DUF1028 domain-containing protein [Modestobacter sp. VKM Ac-2978]